MTLLKSPIALTAILVIAVSIGTDVVLIQSGLLMPVHAPGAKLISAVRLEQPRSALTCQVTNAGCAGGLLTLMNQARAQIGVARLSLDWSLYQSPGCAGAKGHAHAMALTNDIWHQNAQYPQASFPNDLCGSPMAGAQNVAGGWGQSKWDVATATFEQMMAEPHDAGTCAVEDNHACNILSRSYGRVGIGFAQSAQGGWFIAENFEP